MSDIFEQPAPIHTLADVLARLYPENAATRRILSAAQVPAHRIPFGAALDTWFFAVVEAHRHQRLTHLIEVALSEYPHDLILNAIHTELVSS